MKKKEVFDPAARRDLPPRRERVSVFYLHLLTSLRIQLFAQCMYECVYMRVWMVDFVNVRRYSSILSLVVSRFCRRHKNTYSINIIKCIHAFNSLCLIILFIYL